MLTLFFFPSLGESPQNWLLEPIQFVPSRSLKTMQTLWGL